ncbi:MAG: tRNA (N(6)-L-threonylcarbamoyladenosine(37)-C(2))-methylthiotransferase MtaB, partial [Elusimicrobiota bacterium]|nr:tRNA (N(6)-L-threonylcarbamoyladenosine(37)-C(2))-methylthiotransferase MtaB [Elusimicrobiota bacterium]
MKVFIKTFGCRVNQVESQAVFERFQADGHIITNDFNTADLCLLNTCCVTHKADRDVLREIRKIIKANPSARLIITGCAAAAQKEKITAQFPTVEIIYKTDLGKKLFGAEIYWTIREHNNHSRAFVKIQDGCDYFCSYCIVPYARPQKSSKPKQI